MASYICIPSFNWWPSQVKDVDHPTMRANPFEFWTGTQKTPAELGLFGELPKFYIDSQGRVWRLMSSAIVPERPMITQADWDNQSTAAQATPPVRIEPMEVPTGVQNGLASMRNRR